MGLEGTVCCCALPKEEKNTLPRKPTPNVAAGSFGDAYYCSFPGGIDLKWCDLSFQRKDSRKVVKNKKLLN